MHFARCKELNQQRGRLQLDELRWPTAEAGHRRCLYREKVETALAALEIESSIPPDELQHLSTGDFFANLFTDGSHGEAGTGCSGWGLYVATATGTDKFCAPVSISPGTALFHGATLHSNNVGEIEALGAALKWILVNVPANSSVCLCFDSQYAANVIQGIWTPQVNLALVNWARWQLQKVRPKGFTLRGVGSEDILVTMGMTWRMFWPNRVLVVQCNFFQQWKLLTAGALRR